MNFQGPHRPLPRRHLRHNGFWRSLFFLALYLQNMGVTDAGTLGWILGIYFAASTITHPSPVSPSRNFLQEVMLAASFCASPAGRVSPWRDLVP